MPEDSPTGTASGIKCIAPWTHLYIKDKGYGPCCDIIFNTANAVLHESMTSTEKLLALFNDDNFRRIRRAFLENDLPHACKVCIQCGYNKEYDVRDAADLPDFSPEAEATPRSFALIVESPCNINCTFCKSIRTRRDPDRDFRTFASFFERLEAIGWERIDFVRIGGGEPFFNPGFNRFIQSYDWARLGETTLKVTTNATLLHKVLDELDDVRRADFTFSVDASGGTYESLRRGASWERVRANLELFSEAVRQRDGWQATIHSIIMKSTMPHMAGMIRLAHALGFRYSLMNLHGKYYAENVFLFPDIIRGTDWEGHFEEAMDAAGECGFADARAELARLAGHLRDKLAGVHKPLRGFACNQERLRSVQDFFAGLAGRRYAVIGVDDKFIQTCQAADDLPGLQFVGDAGKGITDFMGHPFEDTTALAGDASRLQRWRETLDCVVVSCPSYEFDHYTALARELFPDTELLYAPIFDKATLENIARIAALQKPLVGFCAGGAARMLLAGTDLGRCDIVAFADNNAGIHGSEFEGRPVIAPEAIPEHAGHVVIMSEGFGKEIAAQLRGDLGNGVTILPLF